MTTAASILLRRCRRTIDRHHGAAATNFRCRCVCRQRLRLLQRRRERRRCRRRRNGHRWTRNNAGVLRKAGGRRARVVARRRSTIRRLVGQRDANRLL